jgi:murein L,D-transpeptidase YafK
MAQHHVPARETGDGMVSRAALIASALLLASAAFAASPTATPPDRADSNTAAVHASQGDREEPDAFDADALKRRLAQKGVALGDPVMIRIFKKEAELELWLRKGERFELFAVHPICNWSGSLGPKLAEGDKQSPEGLYSVGPRQLHRSGRWRRSLDIGFPNTYDKAHGRTGSYILVHGGCTSTGCYAMTDPVMKEIFTLSEAALAQGQDRIQVHVFPFRMTELNLAAHAESPWSGFWLGLKTAYDAFERTRVPPRVSVCDDHYAVGETQDEGQGACVANVSEASDAGVRVGNVQKVIRARRARVARKASRRKHARHLAQRGARQESRSRSARVAAQSGASRLGGPKSPRKSSAIRQRTLAR